MKGSKGEASVTSESVGCTVIKKKKMNLSLITERDAQKS
jgi:hypothetical protein